MKAQSNYRYLMIVALLAPSPLSYAVSQYGHHAQGHAYRGPADHPLSSHNQTVEHDAPAGPRTPIAPLTDADRSAVFIDERGHVMHDNAIITFLLLDQLEWRDSDEGEGLGWDITGWIGNDIDRLWIRSEGERSGGETEAAELQLLWGHALGPWWDVVAGVKQGFKPGSAQTWAAVGIQGMVLYGFEAEATLYFGEGGQTAARLAGEYDILLTNRLILQPAAEINFYGKNDRGRALGSGLADAELGLRLRYEIRREFAPYIGLSWTKLYGETADFAAAAGADAEDTRLVVGLRIWF